MTYSILAYDPRTRELGSAVASCSLAVGGTVTYSRYGVGMVNTQHFAHLSTGQRVLDAMERGASPHEALSTELGRTPTPHARQLIAIDTKQRTAGWTGTDCRPTRGHETGATCIAAGNLLAGERVLNEMIAAFEAAPERDLAERLLSALEAGERAGGDLRGRRSAAVRVVPPPDAQVSINADLRVDDHADPLVELRRLLKLFTQEFPAAR